jgi:hypothetical protein
MTFEGAACAGGVCDTKPGDENFAIITDGNNSFEDNVYRVPRTSRPARFVWEQQLSDWEGFRRHGLEPGGCLRFLTLTCEDCRCDMSGKAAQ